MLYCKLIWSTITFSVIATSVASANSTDLCKTPWDQLQKKVSSFENRLAFLNTDGPLNIGTCWWHSRLQRNANYLLQFKPNETKQSKSEMRKIIKNLSRTNKVQTVNGFSNLYEFSNAHSAEMIEMVGQWQLVDTFLRQSWMRGIGPSRVTAENMQKKMNDLYQEVKVDKNISYQMLQLPGPPSHSWLVYDINRLSGGRYEIHAIDSNSDIPQIYTYKPGMTNFVYDIKSRSFGGNEFTPYTQLKKDSFSFKNAIKKYCGTK